MKKSPRLFTCAAVAAGAAVLFAVPVHSQAPQKQLYPAVQAAFTRAPMTLVKHSVLQGPLSNYGKLQYTVYKNAFMPRPGSLHASASAPIQVSLYPLTDAQVTSAHTLFQKTLSKPAGDFHGLFKQMVYAHANSGRVAKSVTPDYFYQVRDMLQTASTVEKTLGYSSLADYLLTHKGVLPTLAPSGMRMMNTANNELLAFYAAEELDALIRTVLARPEKKRDLAPAEWTSFNVLSLFLPEENRANVYKFWLDKDYEAVRALLRDPRLKTKLSERLIRSRYDASIERPIVRMASAAERIAHREQRLQTLLQEKKTLSGAISYRQLEHSKKHMIQAILSNEGVQGPTEPVTAELSKSRTEILKLERRLKFVTQQMEQIKAEIVFLNMQKSAK